MTKQEFLAEFVRLLDTANPKGVWIKDDELDSWYYDKTIPLPPRMWVVDDKHAELRKQWIDQGKPTIQIKAQDGEWVDLNGTPEWHDYSKYRIKPKEWYEDIPEHGVLCWVKDGENKRWFADVIIKYYPDDVYPYASTWSSYKYAKPMTKEEAMKFIVKKG